MAKMHELKCWPEPFDAMWRGLKNFEVRFNDRDYKRGDILYLREYILAEKRYTGRSMKTKVDYVLNGGFGLEPGYCCMSTGGMYDCKYTDYPKVAENG